MFSEFIKKIKQYRNVLISYFYRNRYIEKKLYKYENIENDYSAWYSIYNVIAHSGGGIDGFIKTNSFESWQFAYDNGTRVFDADLSLSRDGNIVLRHEWSDDLCQDNISEDNIPDLSEFMHTLIYKRYHPMSLYSVIEFMEIHDDIYVACDFKDGIEILEKLIRIFKEKGRIELLNRIIVSLYDYQDYYEARSLYNFKNYAMRQYEDLPHNYYELCEFCLKERIPVCMITRNYVKEHDRFNILTNKGITVFVATVNKIKMFSKYKKKGVKGIVSDWLTEDIIRKEL